MSAYEVRRLRAEEWRQFRDIRLEALQDTPIGFGEWYADAVGKPDEEWRERARRAAESSQSALFGAINGGGRFVGITGVFPKAQPESPAAESQPDEPIPLVYVIYSVYVTPDHRGPKHGVAALLFDAVIAWAREFGGADVVTLLVHEDNARAHTFYRRYGFVDTGESEPYNLDEAKSLLELRYAG